MTKLAQIGFLTNQKMFLYKVVTFSNWIKIAILFWIRLDQICPKWIKLDQTCSNWISQQPKNVSIQSCHIYKLYKNGHFILDQIGSDLSKTDYTWPNWIKKDQNGFGWFFGSNQIKLVQIYPNWSNQFKLVQISSNLIKSDQIASNWFKSDQSELNEIDWNKVDKTGSSQIK